jgi:hypothetical protein
MATTVHLRYSAEGPRHGNPRTLNDVVLDGYAAFWTVRQVQAGDIVRIHWEGNDAEPAAACSFVIARIEAWRVPIVTAKRTEIENTCRLWLEPCSAHDLVAGACPRRPRFNQSGIRYEYDEAAPDTAPTFG